MSFSTLVPLAQFTGTGSTSVFPFPHKYYNDEDIIVVLTDALGVDTVQTITSEYTLSGKAEDAHDTTTGSVTMVTAPAGGGTPEKLTIYRKPALTQITTLLNTNAWYALPVELRLDLIVMMIQEHALQLGRTAQNAVTNLDTPIGLEALVLATGLGLVADLPGKGSVVDADTFMESDSADGNANKKILASVLASYVESKTKGKIICEIFGAGGGASAIVAGALKGTIEMEHPGTLTGYTFLADQSGSIVVDVWKDTYANFPPTVADTIVTGTKATISAATKGQELDLTGTGANWATSFIAGDIFKFNVDSAATITYAILILHYDKTGA